MPHLEHILYGRKKIRVHFRPLKNLDGYYETEKKIIQTECDACVDGYDCCTDENGDDQLCLECGGKRYIEIEVNDGI